MSETRLRLHIDTLVVDGISGLSREALRAAVEQQLQERLAHAVDALQWQPGHYERRSGGSFTLQPAAGANVLGGQIAAAVQHGIGAP